jgi:hypothetical protein
MNQNSIHEEIIGGLKSGNACYHLVQSLCLRRIRKLREATSRFVIAVCLSVCMEQLCSHWTNFDDI